MAEGISLTTALAFYGALLSSILFGWNLYRDLTNKGKLRIHFFIGKGFIPGQPLDENEYLVYSLTNVGRQPMMVIHIGGSMKKDSVIIPSKHLPKMLNPGEYILDYSLNLGLLTEKGLKNLWATDSLGKYHKLRKSVLKNLIKEARKKGIQSNEMKGGEPETLTDQWPEREG